MWSRIRMNTDYSPADLQWSELIENTANPYLQLNLYAGSHQKTEILINVKLTGNLASWNILVLMQEEYDVSIYQQCCLWVWFSSTVSERMTKFLGLFEPQQGHMISLETGHPWCSEFFDIFSSCLDFFLASVLVFFFPCLFCLDFMKEIHHIFKSLWKLNPQTICMLQAKTAMLIV